MEGMEVPYVHGAGEPEPGQELLGPEARAIVDEHLAGIRAVQDGTFDLFYIERSDHSGTIVRPENAAEAERELIERFGPHYPEIVPEPEAE